MTVADDKDIFRKEALDQLSSPEQLEQLVKAALRAAYQGAYLAAIARGQKLLVLTLIGGGVFGNRREDILDAIAEAHAAWAPLSKLDEVRLCLYQRGTAEGTRAKLERLLEVARARRDPTETS